MKATEEKKNSDFRFWTIFILLTILCYISAPKEFSNPRIEFVQPYIWITFGCTHSGHLEAIGFLGFEIPINKKGTVEDKDVILNYLNSKGYNGYSLDSTK